MKYDFAAIEKKWQEKWEQEKPYAAVTGDKKPKFYGLIEFPGSLKKIARGIPLLCLLPGHCTFFCAVCQAFSPKTAARFT